MIRIRRIAGSSMSPALRDGTICVFITKKPNTGSVVLARHAGREIVKRVEKVDGNRFYLVGDNRQESTDSRHYGFVHRGDILGVSMISLPAAVNPPKLTKPYGLWLGRLAAVLLVVMALVHLFRIDTFIPILDEALPGGSVSASFMALLIILSEIFAVPFALRIKLSPLGHIVSGFLLAFAPLWWFLIAIWSYDMPVSTGLLGEFVSLPSTMPMFALCLLWVVFNYYTLYCLGYNRLKISRTLRK